jgi:hypothetical protein
MRNRKSITAALVAGAALLASGAYAIGNQQGGSGSAAAANRAADPGPGPYGRPGPYGGPPGGHERHGPFGPDLSALAGKLGVSESKLRAALAAVRPDRADHGDRGPDHGADRQQFAQDLADALGIDKSKVTAALATLRSKEEARHKQMRDAFVAALAKRLGLPESKVSAALDSLPHPQHGPGHGPW